MSIPVDIYNLDPSFLQEDDFEKSEILSHYIEPLIKYLKSKDNMSSSSHNSNRIVATCYQCHKSTSTTYYFHQIPTFTRLSDEIIDTRPLCATCSRKIIIKKK